MEESLKLRNEKKRKKPNFLRQDAHKKSKLENKWRKPRGLQSKMRRKLRSYRKQPSTGYSSPRLVRGLHRTGLKERRVIALKDFEGFDAKAEGVLIGKVGRKRKLDLLKKALELKLTVLNIKEPQAFITKCEEEMKKKKEATKKKDEKKKKSTAEALKKAEEKKKKEGEKEETLEDKAKKDKEEKRKVLEKKE